MIFDKNKLKNLYFEELKITNNCNFVDISNLSKFLDKNIYKIEKLVNNFITNIILIIENEDNLHVSISIKKKNYDNSVSKKNLENSLIDLKDLFKENHKEQTIMHMLIDNYIIDGKKYSSFKNNLTSGNLCLDVNFVSISNKLIFTLSKVLEKYQIKISQFMCGNYISNFFNQNHGELSLMAYKLKNGYNDNEVILVPKNVENKGFFEKFFQLFS
jgi:cell division ATPase FtsA